VDALIERLGLGSCGRTTYRRLSGGQQQRLALARALVVEPPLLLLDEPLSNLDAKLREKMRFELKRLQRDAGITAVYVTHDQVEALTMSNRIAVMNGGRIEQLDRPREIYNAPASRFVADFIGTTNFISGTVLGPDSQAGRWNIRTPAGDMVVQAEFDLAPERRVTVSIRPEDVELCDQAPAANGLNVTSGLLDQKVFLGDSMDCQVKVGDVMLMARAHPSLRTGIGEKLYIRTNPEKCIAIAEDAAGASA
jgi:iron(III) transport system ATP-binding protein